LVLFASTSMLDAAEGVTRAIHSSFGVLVHGRTYQFGFAESNFVFGLSSPTIVFLNAMPAAT
jgi:hypothetical protein